MMFFGLFKSQTHRDREAKIRFRQGKLNVQRFVQQARQSAENYWRLARKAYTLGDDEQFRQLGVNYLKSRESINRWERYLVKLDSLEMRRNEVEATGEFLRSINALTGTILRGATPEEIARMQIEVEQALILADEQEQRLTVAMEAAGTTLTATGDLTDSLLSQLVPEGTSSDTHSRSGDNASLDRQMTDAMRILESQLHHRQADAEAGTSH